MNRFLNNYQMSKLQEVLYKKVEIENYIVKSPIRRIHKIKTYSNELMERLRNSCTNVRNLAIIYLLSSSGIRISELVNLNRDDINFENKSCIVFGKGKKRNRKTKKRSSNRIKRRKSTSS